MNKFITLYNYSCCERYADTEVCRNAVNGVVTDILQELRYKYLIPLPAFVIKVMEKT